MNRDAALTRRSLLGLCAGLALAGSVDRSPRAAQAADLDAWANSFPAGLDVDLAAMVLPADAYPFAGMIAASGRLLRPAEEAATFAVPLDVPESELLEGMRDAGWIARYLGEVLPAEWRSGDPPPTGGWSSITAYADVAGAMQGFALIDESANAWSEVIPARQIGDAARLSRYTGPDAEGRQVDRLRYTFVSGALVGSVAIVPGADTPESAMTPEALAAMAERLLARMQGPGPGLSTRVLRLNPTTALPIGFHKEHYYVIEGELIPHHGDVREALAGAERFNADYGVEANYILYTVFAGEEGVDHRPTWLVGLYRVRDVNAAAQMVRSHARLDMRGGYSDLVELDELPDVDGPVAGSSYTASWADGSQNRGYRVTVAVGDTVAIVDVSAPGGVSQQTAFALVEAQVACLEMGMCAPVAARFAPAPAPATPAG